MDKNIVDLLDINNDLFSLLKIIIDNENNEKLKKKYEKYQINLFERFNKIYYSLNNLHDNNEDIKICNNIPGKKLKVYQLLIPEKWKFNLDFPKEFDSIKDKHELAKNRIWFVKDKIRMNTHHKHKGKQIANPNLPKGLCVFDSILTEIELDEFYEFLEKLFADYRELGIKHSTQKKRGLTYLFTGNKLATQYSKETLEFIKNYNIRMYNIVYSVILYIMRIFCIDSNDPEKVNVFLDHLQLIFLRYEKNSGIWLHIDNVARYDQGPIITMSVGPKKIYYDLTPTLVYDNLDFQPVRLEVSNGNILVMDGSARIEWAHALPFNVPYEKIKYSILFKCDKFGIVKIGYNNIIEMDVISSKIVC